MKPISEQVYKKLKQVSLEVKAKLKRKGIAIPTKNEDGSIAIGRYTVIKCSNFYRICDYSKEIVVDKINLPQSAILLANNLAIGKYLDQNLLSKDRNYGYAQFEEELYSRIARKNLKFNLDKADLAFTKSAINKSKKERYRSDILKTFEKLKRFV